MFRTRPPRPLVAAAAAAALLTVGACSSTTTSVPPAPASSSAASPASSSAASPASSSAASPSKTPTGAAATPSPASGGPSVKEVNPAGDIPDNQAYVAYTPPTGGFSVKVPEGWARTELPGGARFADRLNGIVVQSRAGAKPATVADIRQQGQPAVTTDLTSYRLISAKTVVLPAGSAIQATYSAAAPPDPVTGKTVQDDVLVYTVTGTRQQAVLALVGPHGADNVDPWKIVADSFRWTR